MDLMIVLGVKGLLSTQPLPFKPSFSNIFTTLKKVVKNFLRGPRVAVFHRMSAIFLILPLKFTPIGLTCKSCMKYMFPLFLLPRLLYSIRHFCTCKTIHGSETRGSFISIDPLKLSPTSVWLKIISTFPNSG